MSITGQLLFKNLADTADTASANIKKAHRVGIRRF